MKKRMLRIAALAMAATMTISLAACGGGSDDTSSGGTDTKTESGTEGGSQDSSDSSASADNSSDDGDKTITYWNIGTEGADKEALEYAVTEFNKNTQSGYTVENVPTQNDKYKEKLVIAMSSGECPDMYTSWSGGPMNEYIDSGYAQPLDDLYEEFGLKEQYMDAALAQATYKE